MSWKKLNSAIALLALVPSWLGLFGDWGWLLDVMANFRWQYLLASVAILAWAAWQKQRALAVAALLTFALNAVLVGRLAWPGEVRASEVAGDFSLRVVSLNVLTPNARKQDVLDYLLHSGADVISLVEVDQAWVDAMAPLQAKYPHRIAHPRLDHFGVAMFSRIALEGAQVLELGLPSAQATINHQGHRLVIIGTHPMSPGRPALSRERDVQLQLLSDHVGKLTDPVLLVGDLNATPWSAGMRIITAGRLRFRSLQPPWTPTWQARSIIAVPIDHVLVTAPLVVTRRSVGPDVGSDHRPIEATVGWAKPAAGQ